MLMPEESQNMVAVMSAMTARVPGDLMTWSSSGSRHPGHVPAVSAVGSGT